MDQKRQIKISKYLSKHLRHRPEQIGLSLEAGGWVDIDDLLSACASQHFPITHDELETVVAQSDKQRFAIDKDKNRIRANQGHSVEVDLHLQSRIPPAVLYHGTGQQSVPAILHAGLIKMSRHHVHLSPDIETARKVGQRHGPPVIFAIAAATMHQDNILFYCSENGVWLVDHFPPQYLSILELS